MKKWIINVIHMSHTDIGYTDTQARIIKNQVNYLKNIVVDYKKDKTKFDNFVWIAESFFIVEEFWKNATKEEKDIFLEMLDKKIVSLSASYLNLSELANKNLYDKIVKRSKRVAGDMNYNLTSAITNDINGFSYGWAGALADNGINNLFFGLHTHHGMYPCFKKQNPFYWKTKEGKKILVWVGEHYQIGNEMGIVDTPFGNYILQSEFEQGYFDTKKQISESKKRISAYLENLTKDGYQFDNVPISTLGAATDNAPYNLSIRDRVQLLNEEFKDMNIEFKMVGLEEFFTNIESEGKKIDEHNGDWPDWWTDGSGSKPMSVRIFRQAQRNYELISKLDIKSDLIDELEKNLILFSEHTFGSWDSIEVPNIFYNVEIDQMKASYASQALAISSQLLDDYTDRKVFKTSYDEIVEVEIHNPFAVEHKQLINVSSYLAWKEVQSFDGKIIVKQDGKVVESFAQTTYYMNIPQVAHYALVDMSKTKTLLTIEKDNTKKEVVMTSPQTTFSADKVSDWYNPLNNDRVLLVNNTFKNDFVEIKWNDNEIYSLKTLITNEELIDESQEGLFTPVYDLSELHYDNETMNLGRRHTGRNRRGSKFQKFVGKITNVEHVAQDLERTILVFTYEIKGSKLYKLTLVIENRTQTLNAKIEIIKDVEWSIENMYISLPFAKETSKTLFDKGDFFEIRKEQIPGTLIDYYAIQDGIKVDTDKSTTLISSKDAHLFWTGTFNYEKRFLAHDDRNPYKPTLYAWIMNNAWETNFQASLGGFHEFNFAINLNPKKLDEDKSHNKLKMMNNTFLTTRVVK